LEERNFVCTKKMGKGKNLQRERKTKGLASKCGRGAKTASADGARRGGKKVSETKYLSRARAMRCRREELFERAERVPMGGGERRKLEERLQKKQNGHER